MNMKKEIASLLVLLAFCIPAMAVDMPDMVGNWTGNFSSVGWFKNTHWMASGNADYWEEENTLVIEEQNGTRFVGKLIPAENPLAAEVVLGVISSDNESITLVDEDGYLWGWMISPTEMELFDQEVDMDSMAAGAGIFTKE
jgi:hypothetical protein